MSLSITTSDQLHILNVIFRAGQRDGIWAWDVDAKEMVLVIPVVLAMLGDNPMQSELSCHVGLAGKFFCRCCWVRGRDTEDAEDATRARHGHDNSDADSVNSRGSDATNSNETKKKGRAAETMQELVDRARRFLGMRQFTMHSTRC